MKPGVVVRPTEDDGGCVLHLSNACLVNPTSQNKTYLQVVCKGKTYCLCVLESGKTENVPLDLFLSIESGIEFKAIGGPNEVHLVGYFEPQDSENCDDVDVSDDELKARIEDARNRAGKQSFAMMKAGEGDEVREIYTHYICAYIGSTLCAEHFLEYLVCAHFRLYIFQIG